MAPPETVVLLQRWHGGDQTALHELIEQELPWIREQVRRRMGPVLQDRAESDDYVQDAMVRVLKYGPKFTISDRPAFRGMMARLIENVLRDRLDYHAAQKRSDARLQSLPRDTVLDLDPPRRTVARPSTIANRNEEIAGLWLAIDLLEPDDREVILLRQWEGLSFDEIAQRLGTEEGTARMRFHRALPKLAKRMSQLRAGDLSDLAAG